MSLWKKLFGQTNKEVVIDFASVEIGNQQWMTENLNVDKFRNGDPISEIKTAQEWKESKEASMPAWCYYNNDPAYGEIYGKLYNWYAVNDQRGLAPLGWQIPSDKDWTILTELLGGKEIEKKLENKRLYWYDSLAWYAPLAGGKMKSTGTQYWNSPNEDATNSSGFSGLPGGIRSGWGSFCRMGYASYWWSSSVHDEFTSWVRNLEYNNGIISKSLSVFFAGNSVRCLKVKADNIDETNYSSVIISNQEWMTENLNLDKFRNGDPIPEAKSSSEWEIAGENMKPAWCYYDNDVANGKIFGKLYNFYAVKDPRMLAPEGWHVPSDLEWNKLTDYLGSEVKAGGKLKSTLLWKSPNIGATNESGFSGLPGGTRDNYGKFDNIGIYGCWWSSTGVNLDKNIWVRILTYNFDVVTRGYPSGKYGFSIRCIKD